MKALLIAAGVVAGTLLVLFTFRQPLAEKAMAWGMAAAGLPPVALRVDEIGPGELRLSSVTAGKALRIKGITARYTLAGLWEKRIERVVVRGLDADLSRPTEGFFGALYERFSGAEADDGDPPPPLPAIRLEDARLRGELPQGRFDFRLNGDLRPDVSGAFTAKGAAALKSADGAEQLVVKDVSFRFSLGPGADAVTLNLDHAMAKDATGAARMAPLTLTGLVEVGVSQQSLWLDLTGDGTGSVHVSGKGTWGGERPSGEVRVETQALDLVLPGVALKGLTAVLDGGFGALDVATVAAQLDGVSVAAGDQRVRLSDGRLSISGASPDDGVLRIDRLSLADGARQPRFPPLTISGTARLTDGSVNANGTLRTRDQKLGLDFELTHGFGDGLGGGAGEGTVRLAEVNLGPGGFDVARWLPGDVNVDVAGLTGRLAGDAALKWRGDAPLDGNLRLDLNNIAYRAHEKALIKGVTGRLSLSGLDPAHAVPIAYRGRLSVESGTESVALGGVELDGAVRPAVRGADLKLSVAQLRHEGAAPVIAPLALLGRVRADAKTARFEISARQAENASVPVLLSVAGRHELAGGSGKATLNIPPLTFSEGGLQPSDLSAVLDLGAPTTGRVGGGATLRWGPGSWDGDALIALTDVAAGTEAARVDGLTGEIRLSGLNPLRMESPQTLTARRIDGPLPLRRPLARFRFDGTDLGQGGGKLIFDEVEVEVAGGTARLAATTLDLGAARNRLPLALTSIDMQKLFALLDMEGVSGTGVLEGTVPLVIGKDAISLSDALLKARDRGVLNIRSGQVKQALAGGGAQVELLLQVLDDFRYEHLSLAVEDVSEGESVIRLTTEGHNPAVKNGRKFVLNVNLSTNLQRILAVVLEGYRLSGEAIRATLGRR